MKTSIWIGSALVGMLVCTFFGSLAGRSMQMAIDDPKFAELEAAFESANKTADRWHADAIEYRGLSIDLRLHLDRAEIELAVMRRDRRLLEPYIKDGSLVIVREPGK